jgi:phosphatidylinositol glycan class B
MKYIISTFPSAVDLEFPRSPYPTSLPGSQPWQDDNDAEVPIYPWKHTWPRHLVFFGAFLQREGMKELFEEKGYVEVWKKGREWEGEGERKGGVRVWSWQDRQ